MTVLPAALLASTSGSGSPWVLIVSGLQLMMAVIVFAATRRDVRLGHELVLEARLPAYDVGASLRAERCEFRAINFGPAAVRVKLTAADGRALCDEVIKGGDEIRPHVERPSGRYVLSIGDRSGVIEHRYSIDVSASKRQQAQTVEVRFPLVEPERVYA